MSAYKDALHISAHETGGRADLAVELLHTGAGVVVLEDSLALRPSIEGLLCEVINSKTTDPRHYKAAVESAQQLLAASVLSAAASSKRLSWLVVEDYGTGTVELWRAS